jgi:5S rRNA maturation endonuclease (ribonuclease M5)
VTVERFISRLTSAGFKAKQEGQGFRAQCPAHGGEGLNMTVRPHAEGGVVCTCHSHQCPRQAIAEALGLTMNDLVAESGESRPEKRETVYPYRDEEGAVLFEVVREDGGPDGKKIWQRRPGQTKGGLGDVRRVLYDLPELLATEPGGVVAIVEGEKCCEALGKRGVTATTNPHGAGKWRQEFTDWLKAKLPGRRFVIFPDHDEQGHKHAEEVYHSLRRAGLKVKTALMEGLKPKEDVADWLKTHTDADLQAILYPAGTGAAGEIDAADLLAKTFDPLRWPIRSLLPEGLAIFAGPSKACKSLALLRDRDRGRLRRPGVRADRGGARPGAVSGARGQRAAAAGADPQSAARRADAARADAQGRRRLGGRRLRGIRRGLDRPERRGPADHRGRAAEDPPGAGQGRLRIRPGLRYPRRAAAALPGPPDRHAGRPPHPEDEGRGPLRHDLAGSTAIQGAADTLLALMRVRGEEDATLHVTGRDVNSDGLALRWDDQECGWRLLGKAADNKLSSERTKILKLLRDAKTDLGPAEISGALSMNPGAVRYLLGQMVEDGQITKSHYGRYTMTQVQKMTRYE